MTAFCQVTDTCRYNGVLKIGIWAEFVNCVPSVCPDKICPRSKLLHPMTAAFPSNFCDDNFRGLSHGMLWTFAWIMPIDGGQTLPLLNATLNLKSGLCFGPIPGHKPSSFPKTHRMGHVLIRDDGFLQSPLLCRFDSSEMIYRFPIS